MAVKIIAYKEDGWMSPNTDFRMWDHLARAFGADLQMVDAWSEAVIPADHTVIAVDEASAVSLVDYVHPADAVYVFGRTSMNLLDAITEDESLYITVPDPTISLFGVSAAAIVLYDRQG